MHDHLSLCGRGSMPPPGSLTFPPDDELLTPAQVCAKLKIRPKTLYDWISSGTAPPLVKVGRQNRFPASLLQAYLAGRLHSGRGSALASFEALLEAIANDDDAAVVIAAANFKAAVTALDNDARGTVQRIVQAGLSFENDGRGAST